MENEISCIIGKTFKKITVNKNKDEIEFISTNGEHYIMHHEQDCCESVDIEDIDGDLTDLMNSPIIIAEEVNNKDNPRDKNDDSFTWTFYKLATEKGNVTIRWYGSSNGYYSEKVTFYKIEEKKNGK